MATSTATPDEFTTENVLSNISSIKQQISTLSSDLEKLETYVKALPPVKKFSTGYEPFNTFLEAIQQSKHSQPDCLDAFDDLKREVEADADDDESYYAGYHRAKDFVKRITEMNKLFKLGVDKHTIHLTMSIDLNVLTAIKMYTKCLGYEWYIVENASQLVITWIG